MPLQQAVLSRRGEDFASCRRHNAGHCRLQVCPRGAPILQVLVADDETDLQAQERALAEHLKEHPSDPRSVHAYTQRDAAARHAAGRGRGRIGRRAAVCSSTMKCRRAARDRRAARRHWPEIPQHERDTNRFDPSVGRQ
jgi:acyl transferase domain-containing protein